MPEVIEIPELHAGKQLKIMKRKRENGSKT